MSIDVIVDQTLADKTSPQNIHISQQAFLNYNIERIRQFAQFLFGANNFLLSPPTATTTTDQLKGPVCLDARDPVSVVSTINKYGDDRIQSLNNLTNLELAALQPKVELRKVIYEKQIDASSNVQSKAIFEGLIETRSNSFRQIPFLEGDVDDIQIQNVNFSFKNQNPLGADRLVGVNFDLVMLKADSLTRRRTLSGGVDLANNTVPQSEKEDFRFTDLFMRPLPVSATEYDRKSYQIRLTLGWELGDNRQLQESLPGYSTSYEALRAQQITLNLQLVNYDLSFRQDGKIVLNLDYMSIIDDAYEDRSTDIFGGAFGLAEEFSESAERIRLAQKIEELTDLSAQLETQIDNATLAVAGGIGGSIPLGIDIGALQTRRDTVQTDITDLTAELNALNSGRTGGLASLSTNVKTYSRILTDLYERKRVYSFEVPMKKLIQFSPAFQKNLLATHPELFFNALDNMEGVSGDVLNASTDRFTRSQGRNPNEFTAILEEEILNLGEVAQNTDETEKIKAAANVGGTGVANAILQSELSSARARSRRIKFESPERSTTLGGTVPPFTAARERTRSAVSNRTTTDGAASVFYFILYGDLVAAAMRAGEENVARNMREENIGIILNSVLYTRENAIPPVVIERASGAPLAATTRDININLAYVPITIENYANFVKAEIIDKKRTKYPIGEFLRDTLTKLVAPALNLSYFGQKPKQKIVLRANTVDISRRSVPDESGGSYSLESTYNPLLAVMNDPSFTGGGVAATVPSSGGPARRDPLTYTNVGNVEDPPVEAHFLESKISSGRRNIFQSFTYLNCYGFSRGAANLPAVAGNYQGNVTEDQRRGVYHFTPALNRGLLKDVKFSKRATKYLAEASVFDALQDSSDQFTRLWNVFDAELVMVGNNLFAPGSLIFIDTTSTGLGNPTNTNSVSRFMGLGGYYLVVSVDHSIVNSGTGKWETRVKAIWQTSGTRPT